MHELGVFEPKAVLFAVEERAVVGRKQPTFHAPEPTRKRLYRHTHGRFGRERIWIVARLNGWKAKRIHLSS